MSYRRYNARVRMSFRPTIARWPRPFSMGPTPFSHMLPPRRTTIFRPSVTSAAIRANRIMRLRHGYARGLGM